MLAGVSETIFWGSAAISTAVPSSSVMVTGKAAAELGLASGLAVTEADGPLVAGEAMAPVASGGMDVVVPPDEQPARARTADRPRASSGPRRDREDTETSGTSDGTRTTGGVADTRRTPRVADRATEGHQGEECTVLPTFLSKVRACTVGSATGLATRGWFTVAGLCRTLTGFATTRRSTETSAANVALRGAGR